MNTKMTIDDLLNDLNVDVVYNWYKTIALSMFIWEGLPKKMKPEYIEKILYDYGQALFFEDENLGLLVGSCFGEGGQNFYYEFPKYNVVGGGGYNKTIDADKCVLIENNMLRKPTHDFLLLYSQRIADIERTIDVNVDGQKTPYIVACDDKDLLTMKSIYKKKQSNEPVIFANKNLNLASLQVLLTPAPFVGDKLSDLSNFYVNRVLTYLGVNNSNTDKRERLNSDEVNSNNEFIEFNAQNMLELRQSACDKIYEMFGDMLDQKPTVKLREVKQIEPLHNELKNNIG